MAIILYLNVMPESHERILRRIIRRFGSFPTRTYSNSISNDVNVRITYEEHSGRVLKLNKTCALLIRRVPIRRRTLANIRSCDRGIRIKNKRMNQQENVLLLYASDFHVCICFIIFKNSMNHIYHLLFFLDQIIAYFVNSYL